ncbi:MAG: hypothetical protein AAF654_09480 [Myxococcota bacterium]
MAMSQQKRSPLPKPKSKDIKKGMSKILERSKKGGGGNKHSQRQNVEDFQAHAAEVKDVMRGKDVVESIVIAGEPVERAPAAFDGAKMNIVRSWLDSRPLEPKANATTRIPYPRNWNTKRGRYCKFKAPGAGVYGILRARPTF